MGASCQAGKEDKETDEPKQDSLVGKRQGGEDEYIVEKISPAAFAGWHLRSAWPGTESCSCKSRWRVSSNMQARGRGAFFCSDRVFPGFGGRGATMSLGQVQFVVHFVVN